MRLQKTAELANSRGGLILPGPWNTYSRQQLWRSETSASPELTSISFRLSDQFEPVSGRFGFLKPFSVEGPFVFGFQVNLKALQVRRVGSSAS